MSNLDTNGNSGTSGNSCEFYYYQVFYEMWRSSFTKSSDPLVLFFHYCLTRNRYKCLVNDKPGELLPPEWNKAKNFYQLTYRKYDDDFKLEITIIPNTNLMHVQLRRMSDMADSLQHIRLTEYVDEANFKNEDFKLAHKNIEKFYKRIQWTIDHFRPPKNTENNKNNRTNTKNANSNKEKTIKTNSKEEKETSSNKKSNKEQKTHQPPAKSEIPSTFNYLDLIRHIKNEKLEFEANLKSKRRSSTQTVSSTTTSTTLQSNSNYNLADTDILAAEKKEDPQPNNEIEHLEEIQKAAILDTEPKTSKSLSSGPSSSDLNAKTRTKNNNNNNDIYKDKIKRSDLYDYNPITNYFHYNKGASSLKLDEKLINENEFIKNAFEKYKLKQCSVDLFDCMNTSMFKNLTIPIKLTKEMKIQLNLNDASEPKQKRGFGRQNSQRKPVNRKASLNKSVRGRRTRKAKESTDIVSDLNSEACVTDVESKCDTLDDLNRSKDSDDNFLPNLDFELAPLTESNELEPKNETNSKKRKRESTLLSDSINTSIDTPSTSSASLFKLHLSASLASTSTALEQTVSRSNNLSSFLSKSPLKSVYESPTTKSYSETNASTLSSISSQAQTPTKLNKENEQGASNSSLHSAKKLKLDKDEATKKNRLISDILNQVDKNKKIEIQQESPKTNSTTKVQTITSLFSSSKDSSVSILKATSVVSHVCNSKNTDASKNNQECDCEIIEFVKGDSTVQSKLTNFLIKAEKID